MTNDRVRAFITFWQDRERYEPVNMSPEDAEMLGKTSQTLSEAGLLNIANLKDNPVNTRYYRVRCPRRCTN